jgi:hypothetical protein
MSKVPNTTTVNPELAAWLESRQAQLEVKYSTVTPSGQILDWVLLESQTAEPIAKPPTADNRRPVVSDPKRPTSHPTFELGEAGPPGHVPIVRPNVAAVRPTVKLDDFRSKRGGLLVNVNSPSAKPTDPDPFGYFHALSSQWTTAYGSDAWFNVWDPAIDLPSSPGDDHSISQLWVQNYQKPQRQSLEAGLTVDRNLNGDLANHIFTFYTTNGYTAEGNNIGGYNRLDGGWVQYSPTIFPGIRVNGSSTPGQGQLEIGLKYQLFEGNWWLGFNNNESGPWIWMGYYPAGLFDGGLGNVAQWIAFGGEVYSALANPCATQDQMGSGRQAAEGWSYSAYQRNLHVQSDTNGTTVDFDGVPGVDAAANTCTTNDFTIDCVMNSGSSWASYQFFGGPRA